MEVWTSLKIKMPTERDYIVIKDIINNYSNNMRYGLGEVYDGSDLSISIDEIFEFEEYVIVFAEFLLDQICKCAARQKNVEEKKAIEAVSFVIQGYTSYSSGGESYEFIIEKKDNIITVNEKFFDCEILINDHTTSYTTETFRDSRYYSQQRTMRIRKAFFNG